MFVTTEEIPELITDALKVGLVPMVTSSPGLGKSTIIQEIASDFKLKVIDIRLSQCDPTDLNGFPSINIETNKATYVPMDYFPVESDEIPKDKNGWLLLFDEFNSAPLAVQAAAYKIVLDKKVGQSNLHDKVAIICAGNLMTDNAIVNRLSTAMQSRLIHLELQADTKSWLKWANKQDIDYRIVAWINFKEEALHNFDADHSDKTFACPRTWEFLSKLIKNWIKIPASKLPLIMGTIGEGMGLEFISFCEICDKIPTINQIIKNPDTFIFDEEPSSMYAVIGFIANHINKKNIAILIKAIVRFPIEFQIICLQGAIQKNANLSSNPIVDAWLSKNAQELY